MHRSWCARCWSSAKTAASSEEKWACLDRTSGSRMLRGIPRNRHSRRQDGCNICGRRLWYCQAASPARYDSPAPVNRRGRFAQRPRGEHRPCPGPEILCGKLVPCDLFQVGIDVGGINAPPFAPFIEILKEFVSRQIPAPTNDPSQAAVFQIDGMDDAARAAKLKPHSRPIDTHM